MEFNDADKTYKGFDLPMSYQTTLGTYDYLAGINYSSSNILVSIGAQVPITQNNNSFFVENFLTDDIDEVVKRVVEFGGLHEGGEKGDWGSIAYCSDPFGNGFCVINE